MEKQEFCGSELGAKSLKSFGLMLGWGVWMVRQGQSDTILMVRQHPQTNLAELCLDWVLICEYFDSDQIFLSFCSACQHQQSLCNSV